MLSDGGHDLDLVAYRVLEARRATERGWALTPLAGKKPVLTGWTSQPRPSLVQAVAWAKRGNVGLRTGAVSGVYVIDIDEDKGGRLDGLPATVTVLTGGGGRHLYFRAPRSCPRNTSSRLAPHVDTRGEGGQVVFVGSIHPTTGQVYRWAEGLSPDEVALAQLPTWVLDRLIPQPSSAERGALTDEPPLSLHDAIRREYARAAHAEVGARNSALNTAAFCLGRLIGGRLLDESVAVEVLQRAAQASGLFADDGERKCARTIASGLRAGKAHPWT